MEKASRDATEIAPGELAILGELERKVLWLATWTIHNANHCAKATTG